VPFNPSLFLEVARTLDPAGGPSTEAAVRSSCGRAYYSAFLVARERLRVAGFTPPTEGVHQWVIQRLKTARPDPDTLMLKLRTLGERLGSLMRERKLADYDLVVAPEFSTGRGNKAAARADAWMIEFSNIPIDDLKRVVRPG
jgi:hypothetical protein